MERAVVKSERMKERKKGRKEAREWWREIFGRLKRTRGTAGAAARLQGVPLANNSLRLIFIRGPGGGGETKVDQAARDSFQAI